jgi:hypothetical protein
VTGPKSVGVRELTYRMSFLASSVQVCRKVEERPLVAPGPIHHWAASLQLRHNRLK